MSGCVAAIRVFGVLGLACLWGRFWVVVLGGCAFGWCFASCGLVGVGLVLLLVFLLGVLWVFDLRFWVVGWVLFGFWV